MSGTVTINGNTVAGGAGAAGGTNGSGFGGGMFFGGSGTVVFTSAAGETQTIADVLADEFGATGIAGTDSVTLNKAGGGTLVLSGANQYSGGTVIDGGTLQVSTAANLGSGGLAIHNAATLAVTGSSTFTQNVNIAGTPTVSVAGGQTATFNGAIADDILVGSGSLTVNGGGTLALGNGANTYSGGTAVIGNSTLVIGSDGALGAAGAGVALGDAATGGALRYTSGANVTTSRAFTFGAGGGAVDTVGTAAVTITGGTSGNGALIKLGTGTLTLTGASTRTGITVAFEGVLRAGIVDAFGSGTMQVGPTGTLDLNNFDQSVGSISGAGMVTLGSATLTTGADDLSTLFGGDISGTGGLVKTGAGVLVLTGTNTYSGGTTVSAGALSATTPACRATSQTTESSSSTRPAAARLPATSPASGMLVKIGTGTVTLSGVNTLHRRHAHRGRHAGWRYDQPPGRHPQRRQPRVQPGNGRHVCRHASSASGSLTKSGAGTLTLTGQPPTAAARSITGGTLAGSTQSLPGQRFSQRRVAALRRRGSTACSMGRSAVSDSVTKAGAGTLFLNGTNSYTGGTTLNAGTRSSARRRASRGRSSTTACHLFNRTPTAPMPAI